MYRDMRDADKKQDENQNLSQEKNQNLPNCDQVPPLPHPSQSNEALKEIRRLSLGKLPSIRSLDATEYEEFSCPLTCLPAWPNYASLDHLPVPQLKDTLNKLKGFAEVLCSEDEQSELKEKLSAFMESKSSKDLQSNLKIRAEVADNWLSAWWLDVAYLERREALPVNVSPFILFPPNLFEPTEQGQVLYTANLVHAVLDFRELILTRKLPIDHIGKTTFDMSQYDWLFGTYRVPGVHKDTLHLGNQMAKHIIVTRHGRFYFLPVYEANGEVLSVGKLVKLLLDIFDLAKVGPPQHKVGLLTTLARDEWGAIHARLRHESYKNETAFSTIENSLFILCINAPADNYAPKLSDWTTYGHELLLETAASGNFGNRWYDKTLQFVVGTNGTAGVVYEHSPIEGIPVCALIDYVVDSVKAATELQTHSPEENCRDLAVICGPRELRFDLGESDVEALGQAVEAMRTLARNFELGIFTFKAYGKEFLKAQKMSPDSFFQIAIQAAYFKMHGEMTAQYESGTLRRYKLGRTDVIRLPNKETAQFLRNFDSDSLPDSEKAIMLRAAVNAHKQYVSEVCSGQGIDRHLLGLRLIAKDRGEPIPDFLDSAALKKLTKFKLSTSALPSVKNTIMAFGPSQETGYGVCYNMQADVVHVQITAMNTCSVTCAKSLEGFLTEVLNRFKELLENVA